MKDWQYKRDAMNRYFSSLGFTNITPTKRHFVKTRMAVKKFRGAERREP